MDEVEEFIAVLNAECDFLKKNGLMPKLVTEPWRYYSEPLCDENDFQLLRAVINAGQFTVEAESLAIAGDEVGAWGSLAKAQNALLKSLSRCGKKVAKEFGNSTGGKSKGDDVYFKIFILADDLLASGHPERGLAGKIAKKLSDQGYEKTENQIRRIRMKQKHTLVGR
jgi:hypothetical protein